MNPLVIAGTTKSGTVSKSELAIGLFDINDDLLSVSRDGTVLRWPIGDALARR